MAEFVVGHLVADQRQFFELAEDQKAKKWEHEQRGNYRPLSSLSIGILGVGEIGREIARVCKQGFGMRVLGLGVDVCVCGVDWKFENTRCLRLKL